MTAHQMVDAVMTRVSPRTGRFGFWKLALIFIGAAALYATIVRYAQGLGAATHLSDAFPWGLWIGFDLLVGVGLAAGGFCIAATVHVFRIEKYEPIARPAVLTAFLGYLLVIVALLFDLGRPWNIWHPLIMWNPHSVMFEIGWCVMLYTTVLAIEFSPLVFEKLGWHAPLKVLRLIYVPLVIAGVLLSTMHQSSLGTLYVIAEGKLHGLWYTPLLPVFFFISAIAGGLAMTVFESYMSARAFGKRLESDLLDGVARVIVVVLGVFLVWKLEDLAMRGNLGLVFQVTPESVMFWGEMGLGVVLPMILFAMPAIRRSQGGLFFGALLTVLGFVIGRLNVAITGMAGSSGVHYVPSWMEFAVSIALVAAGFVAFGLAVKHLAVFPRHELNARPGAARRSLTGPALLALWGFMAVGLVLFTFAGGPASWTGNGAAPAPPETPGPQPAGFAVPGEWTFPRSEDSPGPVAFRHETHTDTTAGACATCHRDLFSLRETGMPLTGELSYERIHEGDLCASCHDGANAFAVDEGCDVCHAVE